MRVLGISCHYHDAAACMVVDGRIVAAAEEERFSRRKHDAAFPARALRYVLAEAGVVRGDVLDAVAFYDKPLRKLHRALETWLAVAPAGLGSFVRGLPDWVQRRIWIEHTILAALAAEEVGAQRVLFPEHHLSHAASAFFASPFSAAAVLTLDGVGDWATTTLGVGTGGQLRLLAEQRFPHSVGLLYAAFTATCGFRVNDGEYKLMGLAPYGQPRYVDRIRRIVQVHDDGSIHLDLRYFAFHRGERMTSPAFDALFDGPARAPEAPLRQRDLDLARSIQDVTEDIVLRMARHARERTGERRLCLAGGVALNCVANGKLLRAGVFDALWVQPAAGDAGGALGAALAAWHIYLGQPRQADEVHDGMAGALLGPQFDDEDIGAWIAARGLVARPLGRDWAAVVAARLAQGRVVGVCRGRMEFGPRALGSRSILADPRDPEMQRRLNMLIKKREGFRPFAPAVLAERAAECFDLAVASPYMLLTAQVVAQRRLPPLPDEAEADLLARARHPRSDLPAVTHVDGSARVQTVDAAIHPDFHALLSAFAAQTGCPVLLNTSFNVRGEPIVCTPAEAWSCFRRNGIDDLLLGGYLLEREQQPPWSADEERLQPASFG